jgi:Eukaryotic aspartyl protease
LYCLTFTVSDFETPDGILGLALTQANAQGVATVMDQLKDQGLIANQLIGVNLQRASDNLNNGEISFGIIDTGKFSGALTVVPNVGTSGLWEVPVTDASVNGKKLRFQSKTSITDTGTTLMILPPNDAATLHAAIPESVTDNEGNFAFPCNTNTNVAVIFGGTSFSISPKDYVGAPLSGQQNLCQSNIVGQQIGTANQWLLGDVFLKNVYHVRRSF